MAESLTAARPYAKALYEIAGNGDVKQWLPVMELCQALGDNEESKGFLKSHSLTTDTFLATVESLAKSANIGKVPAKFNDFAKVLSGNKRFSLLPEIATLFIDEVNQSNDTVIAEIVSAKLLSDASRDNLIQRLEKKYGKKVEASIEIDKSLIGGAVIKIGDTVIDGSVKGRLEQLTKALN